MGPGEVFLQFAPISFDASTLEIWGPLLNGGRLAVMPPSLPSLEVLGDTLRKHGVTTLWLTAGLFHLMVDERLGDLQSVRQLLAGGDALSLPHVKKAFQGLPSCQLINGYGPTEGTTFTCCYLVTDLAQLRVSVPIGRPISNTQAFILDRHLRPAPPGVTGELYIGGDGLARDYHNRPDLTAERFIPNPLGDVPGARLYKTGDLVRWLPDGNIEFLGRRDLQVKIRGFRIELGEVEAALSSHPALQDAVVVARADIAGEKQLVAYFVSAEGKSVSVDELRDFLRQKLPEHMVPASFVTLEAFPLTPNGKVDRRALPAPDADRRGLAHDFVAPRTEIEELLAVIWSQALGVDEVGIDDNFFSLGGDSIRSVQVLARVQQRGLSLSLQDLFQYQTIRELAKIATAADGAALPEPTQPFSLISDQDRQNLPEDVEDAYPLTMLQAGMVFHSELNPGTAVYHDIFSHHVRAPYNSDALRKAIDVLVRRHDALRTCFALHGFSEPLQMVRRAVEIPIAMGDLRDLSHAEQDRLLRDRVETIKNRLFDWSQAPLVNVELYRRTNDSFQFTLSFHHAILDGWSMVSMLAELFQLYFSFIEHGELTDEPSPLVGGYRDYVAMELQALRSEAGRDYWTNKLSGSSPAHLPHWPDERRDDEAEVHRLDVPISSELSLRLKDLARAASVPIKNVLLAAHLKVISFISGESDVITGLISNGRPEQGDGERLLGLFLNTIPFRQQLSSGSWIDLVQQTFQNEWEALPFRWYPLAEIQRQQGSQALFETAFNFTHFHVASELQARGDIELLGSISFERTNLPLVANFSLDLGSSDVRLLLVTDGANLTRKQTEEVADYYLRTLTAIANEPESRHQSVSLLSDSTRQQLLYDWNSTALEYPRDRTFSELFELQASRVPDRIAVEFEGRQLSYAELNSRSNQLAHHLSESGVGPEVLVGICVERSIEMLVAVLGVLKAGGAYLPLDPEYPLERLSYILQDADVSFLLLQQSLIERLPVGSATTVLLDADWERIAQASGENLAQRATADNLAYVIYTSGSTGNPKGVQVTQGALVNFLNSMEYEPGLTAADSLLAVTTLSFDISALELYLPLLVGARLVIASREAAADGAELLKKLETVTVMQATPTTWRLMLAAGWERRLPVKVLCGGEALPPDLAAQLLDRTASVWNMYGPTETAIWSAVHRVERSDEPVANVSIGRPIANTQIYLLGSNLQPTPIGVPGELYIGGDGVARGYLHRPDLTAEKFGPDPFSPSPGPRLYRTGDLARFKSDGRIEFLGRVDHQVKVRGFRIELGEIETQLLSHPDVRETVVVARHEVADDVRLIAYVVAASESTPEPESLRGYLQERLPEYMLPAAFVPLEEMPLTPSGKVNRLALPAPGEEALAVSRTEVVAPRSEIEQLLHSIW
ncbi:MAG TPA: amino acid adenylation domain-containing protein, partial [Pyrinomonadaceae bacterium]|nr:amino acid adenylation domain-containing protein [Pyrinomonadaceae bacterium]